MMKWIASILLIVGCCVIGSTGFAQKTKLNFKSGNFSGIDYIMITQKQGGKKSWQMVIDCNHYIKDIGKTLFIRKYVWTGKATSTWHLMRDSAMLAGIGQRNYVMAGVLPLSDEDLATIRMAFEKYPVLVKQYNLNADQLKASLGWYEVKK
jgi:hypothetical protein